MNIFQIIIALFIFNKINYVGADEITGWTTSTLQIQTPDYRRGFYLESNQKIYLLGGPNALVFDPVTQSITQDLTPFTAPPQLYASYGTFVKGNINKYYISNSNNQNTIQSFDPINGVVNTNVFTLSKSLQRGCLTSNGVDTLYMLYTSFLYQSPSVKSTLTKLDLTTGTLTEQTLSTNPQYYDSGVCPYYNGYIYALFGQDQNSLTKITKYNVAANSWTTLASEIPTTETGGTKADAVIGNDGYIYIGGGGLNGGFARMIWKFNTADDTLSRVPDLSAERTFSALVYSKLDNRLYVFGGQNPESVKSSYEYSNALITDPCAGITCTAPDLCTLSTCINGQCQETPKCASNLVCEAQTGDCKRDCNAFKIDEFLLDCSAEFSGNEADIQTLQNKVTALETDLAEGGNTESRLDQIEAEIGTNDDDILALQGGVNTNQGDIATINAALADGGPIDTRLDQIETNIASNDVDIATNLASITTINSQLADNGPIDTRLDQIETDISSNDVDILALQGDVNTNQGDIATINSQLADNGPIDSRLDQIEAQIGTNDNDIVAINTQISSIQDDLSKFSAQSESSFANVLKNGEGISSPHSFISSENKDTLIIFLLLLNTVITIGACISCVLWKKSTIKYGKYENVKVYSSADENQQLNM